MDVGFFSMIDTTEARLGSGGGIGGVKSFS